MILHICNVCRVEFFKLRDHTFVAACTSRNNSNNYIFIHVLHNSAIIIIIIYLVYIGIQLRLCCESSPHAHFLLLLIFSLISSSCIQVAQRNIVPCLYLQCILHARPAHFPRFDYNNTIWWKVQILKLSVVQWCMSMSERCDELNIEYSGSEYT